MNFERRVGPSATFLDPDILEGVEVARGPGSVAYGSDAFGGVIAATTRKVAPGAPLAVRLRARSAPACPSAASAATCRKAPARAASSSPAHARDVDDWDNPAGTPSTPATTTAACCARDTQVVGRAPVGRLPGRLRPRHRAAARQLVHRAVLLPERGLAPFHRRVRTARGRPLRRDLACTPSTATTTQVTDQDRFATATTARSVERADISAHDFQVRGYARRPLGPARWEMGVDVNGRDGLRALDIIERTTSTAALLRTTDNVSIDSAQRLDSAVYTQPRRGGAAVAVAGRRRAARLRGIEELRRLLRRPLGEPRRCLGLPLADGLERSAASSFMAQVARGFREPVLSDRYFRGPSGRGFITGNPDLDPETSLQFDPGVRYTSRRVRAAVYGYHYRIADLIERYQTTTDNFFFRNRGRARVRGVEVESAGRSAVALTLDGGFPGGARPRPRSGGRPRRHHRRDRLAAGDGAVRRARLRSGAGGVVRRGRSPRPDRARRQRLHPGGRRRRRDDRQYLELRGLVRNLFDDEYFASQDVRAVLAPGRAASITAVVRF